MILSFIAHELFCDNCKSLHDEIYTKYLINCTVFLILVVGKNSLEQRQLGYWEGVRYPGWDEFILGHLPPGRETVRGVYCYTGVNILFQVHYTQYSKKPC